MLMTVWPTAALNAVCVLFCNVVTAASVTDSSRMTIVAVTFTLAEVIARIILLAVTLRRRARPSRKMSCAASSKDTTVPASTKSTRTICA